MADNGNSDLTFTSKLWKAADKLRNNMDAAEYKHIVLGLIFLKYISDVFNEVFKELESNKKNYSDPEDIDEYRMRNIFWVPPEARWQHLQKNAKQPAIGKSIDDAMDAIERNNPSLKGVLPKNYARPALDKQRLGELIDLIGTIGLGDKENRSKDLLGRVYEYFLGQFADAEGKKGGQFYTPRCIVKLLVAMLEPYKGRVFDPCCGSGGMFVQSERFIEEHGGRIGDISVYGQESNQTTWRLCKMNLALRGIDANIAWVQHFIYHLAPAGTTGFVLANGSMSSNTAGEGNIRKSIIEADLVDCMVALPSQLFYNTMIMACLWFIAKDKKNHLIAGGAQDGKFRDRRDQTLFIDARNMGVMIDRRHRELTDDDILLSVRAPVGDLNRTLVKCIIGRGLASIHEKNRRNSYIYYMLQNSINWWKNFNAEGTVFGAVNKDDVNNFQIVIPPKDFGNQLNTFLMNIDERVRNNCIQNRRLSQIRDSLLPRLMSGKIRVNYDRTAPRG